MAYSPYSRVAIDKDEIKDFRKEYFLPDQISTDFRQREDDEFLRFLNSLRTSPKNPKYKDIKEEYYTLWQELLVRNSKLSSVKSIVKKIEKTKERYAVIEAATDVPWYVVGAIHSMESSLNFNTHLHNGDSLKARTKNVPKGRPKKGKPPFSWEESAIDAIIYDGLDQVPAWNIERICFYLERYNGWGYRKFHPEVKSPYLWSFSNHYTKGKYVADGKWSSEAVSKQCGAIVLIKMMVELGIIDAIYSEIERQYRARSLVGLRDRSLATQMIALAETRIGEEYDWGADVDIDDEDWHGPWDCAEFTTWLYYQTTGKVFGCIDNEAAIKNLEPYSQSWLRDAKVSDKSVSISSAAKTPGAFLVRKKRPGKPGHVAMSVGDGTTIEAKSAADGVTHDVIENRVWDAAVALV